MNWFVFTVAAFAVFRISELIVYDKIFAWFRELFSGVKFINDLVTCFYCCSIWVALFDTLYAHYLGYVDWLHSFGYFVALSGAACVIYRAIRERK